MACIETFNPVWLVAALNALALLVTIGWAFYISTVGLRERKAQSIREASCDVIAAAQEIHLWSGFCTLGDPNDAQLKKISAQGKFTGAEQKLLLSLNRGHPKYQCLEEASKLLGERADFVPDEFGNDPKSGRWDKALADFVVVSRQIVDEQVKFEFLS